MGVESYKIQGPIQKFEPVMQIYNGAVRLECVARGEEFRVTMFSVYRRTFGYFPYNLKSCVLFLANLN